MNHTFHTLEFDTVLEQLEALACTADAKEKIRALEPYLYEGDVKRAQRETTVSYTHLIINIAKL